MTLAYSFAELTNTKFIDWEETESPSDAAGFILTGYTTANDASVEKQSPYITTYLTRTEENVEEIDGELVPMKQSGCKLQSQWSWANSVASKKWSPEFEVYRYKRPRFIEDAEDDFKLARENIKDMLEQSKDIMEEYTELVKGTDAPRAFEVFSKMALSHAELAKNLMDLHEQKQKLKQTTEQDVQKENPLN